MNFVKDLMSIINRKKEHDAAKDTSPSMKEGDHGKIFGINRKIVVGTGILFVTVFIIAFIFASDNNDKKSDDKTKPNEKTEIATSSSANSKTGQFADDYDKLLKSDNKVNGTKNTTANKNQQVQAVRTDSSNGESTAASVPAIQHSSGGYSQAYTLPYMAGTYSQPQVQAVPTTASSSSDTSKDSGNPLKDSFKAAIAFALGNTGGDSMAAGTAATSTASAAPSTASSAVAVFYTAPSANSIQIGTLIPVVLCTGINSDSGGQIKAMIESDVYDSLSQSTVLIPAGSYLFGTFDNGKASSNGRISLTFSTLITPDGSSWSIGDSMIAADGAGAAGIAGEVNNHTGKAIGSGILTSAIAALGSVASGNTSTTSTTYTAGQLAEQGAMANLISTASKLFEKGTNVQSTVTVPAGYEFNVYVTKTINF